MADTELIKKSVTAGDYADTPRGGVINFMLPWYPGAAVGLPPTPPDWWSRSRDYTLRSTTHYEDMWKAAIEIAITKMASLSWEVDSEIPLRARRGQDILNDSDWFGLLAKGLRDFLTTDNGQFIEIVRAAKSPVSRVLGLAHLDSIRCTRTGDNEIPVIYADRKGREHEIRAENVIFISDMPDPGDTWFGVGECAASGAYRSIYKLAVIERYVSEKVSGRRPLAIHFVSSVGQRQLDGIIQSAEEGAARQGLLSYMGAIVVPLMDASTPPEVATVPLAEMPDRFNRKEEYDIALYSYAANIGLDIQDLQPLTGQPLGTGAQSQVLDEKQKGKGLVYWKKILPAELNLKVFDDLTTFAFIEKDYRDQERQAAISKTRAEVSGIRIDKGMTTPAQEVQIQVDWDELPNEFLPEDITGETLADDEKPEQEATPEEAAAVEDMATPEEKPTEQPKPEQAQTTKELIAEMRRANDLLEAALKADDEDGRDEGDPGPFKTARQRKWFFASGADDGSHEKKGGAEKKPKGDTKTKPEGSKESKLPGTKPSGGVLNEYENGANEEVNKNVADFAKNPKTGKIEGYYTINEKYAMSKSPGELFNYNQTSSQKDEIVTNISKDTGIEYEAVNGVIHSWAISSNDTSYQSLLTQKMASEEFGFEMSEWQLEKWNSIVANRSEYSSYSSNLPNYLRSAFEDENGKFLFGGKYGSNEEATRAILRSMYSQTQEYYRVNNVSEVLLFRGADIDDILNVGTNVDIATNVLESWSIHPRVARGFGNRVFGSRIPVGNILSNARTGFGCLGEFECVVIGSNNNITTVLK